MKYSPRIIVIGAGFSGLTTAYRLMQKGCDVVLYEARERVGGRVLSVLLEDENGMQYPAELGAQNIKHGGDAKHVLALANELSLDVRYESREHMHLKYFDGVTTHDLAMLLKTYNFTPESLWQNLVDMSKKAKDMDEILRKLFHSNEVLYQSSRALLTAYEGGVPEKLSPRYITTLYTMLTPTFECAQINDGNVKIAEVLAQQLGSRIKVKKILMKIEKNKEGDFIVTFHDGETAQAAVVVLTIPCPVYKDISFGDTVISHDRLKNIQNVGYGSSATMLVPVAKKDVSEYTVYLNQSLISWKVAKSDPVTLYYFGKYARFTDGSLQELFSNALPLIKHEYTLSNDKSPCVARDKNFAVYHQPVAHSWSEDPFAQGAYSYIGAKQEEIFTAQTECAGEKVRTLFAPINNLFFAGEHTTILLDVLGTMEAAVESGERIARIIERTHPIN